MPTFQYTAKDMEGKQVKGELFRDSSQQVVTELKMRKLFPVRVVEKADKASNANAGRDLFKKKIKRRHIAIFSRQFASMLQAGVPLPVILDVLIQQERNPSFKEVMEDINSEVMKGNTLSGAMSAHKVFPPLLISMVQVGEANGRLDIAFERVAVNMEKELKLLARIKGAMIYPIILLSVCIIASILLTVFVMPVFTNMFNSMGAKLPPTTRAFLAVSGFIRSYWYAVLGMVFLLGVLIYRVMKNPGARNKIDRMVFKIPIIGRLQNTIFMARFCRTFSALIEGGVGVVVSLETVKNVIHNLYISKCFDEIIRDVQSGFAISSALSKLGTFTPLVVSMVRIGEESGRLGDVLSRTAALYEDESDAQLQKTTALMEPLITVFMAFIIGFVVISIVQPMFQMYRMISHGG